VSPPDDDDRGALVALSGLSGMGPGRIRALVDGSSPRRAWCGIRSGTVEITPRLQRSCTGKHDAHSLLRQWGAAAQTIDPAAELARHRDAAVTVLAPGDAAWPFTLDPDPPAVLFAVGSPTLLGDVPRVAIVGTRQCTAYGTATANDLGAALARAGVSVVSGLAAGIDGAAHVGALAGGTAAAPPVGVVATGLDVVYPRGHRLLWSSVAAAGLLVSEVPLGTGPSRWRFPARNRIIAALADVVVVVESPVTGGSMHTVDEALRRGVQVFAVPGPVSSRASGGTNRLLADGASALCGVDDVLLALGLDAAPDLGSAPGPPTGAAGQLLEALGWRPGTLDQLVAATGLSFGAAALAADELERAGWVRVDGGWLERRR
jgi:DNA processing protein